MTGPVDRNRAANVLAVLVLIAIVLPFGVVAVPQLAGADHSYVVLSGSMQPAMGAGDVVIVEEVPPEQITKGDVITFGNGQDVTTHEVVAIDEGGGDRTFTTKGIANDAADPRPVAAEDLVGRVAFTIPWIGHVVLFAQTKLGILTLVVVPGVLLFVSELFDLLSSESETGTTSTEETEP